MKTIGFCLPWAFVTCAHAAGMSPQDFAAGYPIVLSSEASAYRIALPVTIYQGTVNDELEDLAVFNSRGEAVPFFIRSSARDTEPAHAPEFLPLFPLLGATPTTAAEMRITVDSPGVDSPGVDSPGVGLRRLTLRMNRSSVVPGSAVPRQYILDARAFEYSVAALQLVWAQDPVGYSGRVRIESSDDLDSWRTVAAAAPVASLQADGREFVHARIEFPATRGKFWRLSWVSGAPSFPLAKVLAEFAENRANPGWSAETVGGRQDPRRPADYEFDLGGHAPVERIDLRLTEANSIVAVDLYSRKSAKDAWSFVTPGRFYRIHTPRGDDHNQPIDVPLSRDRYWLARVPAGNPIFAGDLSLVAAWHPSEIVFLAQGSPPFLLAYGSSSSRAPRTELTSLIAGIAVAPAVLGDARTLGGMARLAAARPPVQWRRWVLWLVLLGALAALAYMAHGLLEETGAPHNSRPKRLDV